MADGPESKERRRRPRVKLDGGITAKVQTVLMAPVLDLSATGALVEVANALKPGALCNFRLPLGSGQALKLNARVVRSYLCALSSGEGEKVARYRAALEFVDVSQEDAITLNAHLEDLEEGRVSAEIVAETSEEV